MSTFDCPACAREHDIGAYPDHLSDTQNNRFEFECDCGTSFECEVDWDPQIWVLEDTVKQPKSTRAASLADQAGER